MLAEKRENARHAREERQLRYTQVSLAIASVALLSSVVAVWDGSRRNAESILIQQQVAEDSWKFARASVQPWLTSKQRESDDGGVVLELQNSGVGPAIVKYWALMLDGRKIESWDKLESALGTSHSVRTRFTLTSTPTIAPGEVVELLNEPDANNAALIGDAVRSERLGIEFCYCSVLGDCRHSEAVTPVDSCKKFRSE